MTPPTSVTAALIFWNAGAQLGEVVGATRISPSWSSPISLTVRQTRTVPSTIPGDPGNPIILVKSPEAMLLSLAHWAIDAEVIPQRTMVNGSLIVSGTVPMASGGVHFRNFSMVLLRQAISSGHMRGPRELLPVAHPVTRSHSASLISERFMYQTSSTSLINLCSTMIRATSRILFQKRLWNQCSTYKR